MDFDLDLALGGKREVTAVASDSPLMGDVKEDPEVGSFVFRELYYTVVDEMYNNSNNSSVESQGFAGDGPSTMVRPATCAADGSEGTCGADAPPPADEFKALFEEAVESDDGPDVRLVCLWESVLNCRGFSDEDCPPDVVEGPCASGPRAVYGGEAPCRCVRCPLVVGLDKPRGCASAVVGRGTAALKAVTATRLMAKAVAVAAEAAFLLLLLFVTYFILACLT